jgi:hypothetical protein
LTSLVDPGEKMAFLLRIGNHRGFRQGRQNRIQVNLSRDGIKQPECRINRKKGDRSSEVRWEAGCESAPLPVVAAFQPLPHPAQMLVGWKPQKAILSQKVTATSRQTWTPDPTLLLWVHYFNLFSVPIYNGRPEKALTSKGCCEDYLRQSGHVTSPQETGHTVVVDGEVLGPTPIRVGPSTLWMLGKGQHSLFLVCGKGAVDNAIGDP